ncbi:hypothetical protein LXL04_033467 [Taraxacum kok-saghyz]
METSVPSRTRQHKAFIHNQPPATLNGFRHPPPSATASPKSPFDASPVDTTFHCDVYNFKPLQRLQNTGDPGFLQQLTTCSIDLRQKFYNTTSPMHHLLQFHYVIIF